MDLNHQGTIEAPDTEFLHDFRVACRRARSALNQLKGVFSPEQIQDFRDDFAWLSDRTGPTRDLDVYLLDFNSYQAQLPEEQQADLEAFRELLQTENAKEQKLLAKDLQSKRYRKVPLKLGGFFNRSDSFYNYWWGSRSSQDSIKKTP